MTPTPTHSPEKPATPRTDAAAEYTGSNIDQVAMMTGLARQLERELIAATTPEPVSQSDIAKEAAEKFNYDWNCTTAQWSDLGDYIQRAIDRASKVPATTPTSDAGLGKLIETVEGDPSNARTEVTPDLELLVCNECQGAGQANDGEAFIDAACPKCNGSGHFVNVQKYDALDKKFSQLVGQLTALQSRAENAERPWTVQLCLPSSDGPFDKVTCRLIDTGHADRILVVASDEVNKLEADLSAARAELAEEQKRKIDACIAWTEAQDQLTALREEHEKLKDLIEAERTAEQKRAEAFLEARKEYEQEAAAMRERAEGLA